MKCATEALLAEAAPRRFVTFPWDAHLLAHLQNYRHVSATEWAHIRSNLMEFQALAQLAGWSDPLPDDLTEQLRATWDAMYLQPSTMRAKVLHIRDWLSAGVEAGWLSHNPLGMRRAKLVARMVASPLPDVNFAQVVSRLDARTDAARYAALRARGLSDATIRTLTWDELLALPRSVVKRHWAPALLRRMEQMGQVRRRCPVFAARGDEPHSLGFFRILWRRAVLLSEYASTSARRPVIEIFFPFHNKRTPRFQHHEVSHLKAPQTDPVQRSAGRLARYEEAP
jgi:hypothetical protein